MNTEFTTKQAREIFEKLALDERIPYAHANYCSVRREAMIGIMLDEFGVPPENIGRIMVESSDRMNTPRPDSVINEERYKDAVWVQRHIAMDEKRKKGNTLDTEERREFRDNYTGWRRHTAVTLKMYDPFMEQEIEMVLDPHMNPTRMMTVDEFTSSLQRRSLSQLVSEQSPLLQPSTLVRKHDPSYLDCNMDKNDILRNKIKKIDSLKDIRVQLSSKGLTNAQYRAKWEELNDWSRTPGL